MGKKCKKKRKIQGCAIDSFLSKNYFWVKSDYWKDGVDLISGFSSSAYVYTPPQTASNVSIYADDGMGNIRLKWTNPSAPASG